MNESRVQTVLLAACLVVLVAIAVQVSPRDGGLVPEQMATTFIPADDVKAIDKLSSLKLDGFRIHAAIPSEHGHRVYGNYPRGHRPEYGEGISHAWTHLDGKE